MTLSPSMIAHMETLFQCPITGQRMRWMSNSDIQQLNKEIASTSTGLSHYSQEPVEREVVSGFITRDENIIYPVESGIVLMLPELAIIRNREALQVQPDKVIIGYSTGARTFYESIGWAKDDAGDFIDSSHHVDLRPVVRDYQHRCLMRVKDYLPAQGTYLLDVASGPLHFPEHRRYSENFDIRICVDIALSALLEAQKVLPPDRGIFVLGDIVNLPIRTGVVDAAISLHTVYHVPADNQRQAFGELFRVLSTGGRAVVVYNWGNSAIVNLPVRLVRLPFKVQRRIRRVLFSKKPDESTLSLPSHSHSWRWFQDQAWGFDLTIHSWGSMHSSRTKYFIHAKLFGKQILGVVSWLEEKYPKTMGRIGQYPLITYHK